MKSFLRKIWLALGMVWVAPLLLPFIWLKEREFLVADVKRWVEALSLPERALFVQLLVLLRKAPEFRNLYYYRLFKGNVMVRLLKYALKIVYRELPLLLLDRSCNIGGGLFIQHGFCTIVMADIGENCWINQQVTIGYKDKSGRPKIGNNVRITAGAKVLGNIQIGDNVVIGANAVVVKDVPENCVVGGVPAYIIKRNGDRVREEL